MQKRQQNGSAAVVVLTAIVIVLLGVLGYVFWKNSSDTDKARTADTTRTRASQTVSAPKYVDLRSDGKDGTGITIKNASDVAKLPAIGEKLSAYLKANVGKPVDRYGTTVATTYIVDRVMGNYMAGTDGVSDVYGIFGPTDGTGEIALVAGTQNLGFSCDELTKAKVPHELVDSKCFAADGSGLVNYK